MSRTIVLAADVAADRARVYEAITSPEGLASFWTPAVTGTGEVGSTLRFGFAEAPVDLEMTVTAADELELVTWDCGGPWPNWSGTAVSWLLAPSDTGTMVVFRHEGWDDGVSDAEFGSVALTWAMVLQALQAYGPSGQPAPALG